MSKTVPMQTAGSVQCQTVGLQFCCLDWLNYVNMVSFYEAIEPRFQSVQPPMHIGQRRAQLNFEEVESRW